MIVKRGEASRLLEQRYPGGKEIRKSLDYERRKYDFDGLYLLFSMQALDHTCDGLQNLHLLRVLSKSRSTSNIKSD